MAQPTGTLSTRGVGRLLGIPHRTLVDWLNADLIAPERYEGAKGPNRWGHAWHLGDVQTAKMVLELRRNGLPMQRLKRAAKALREAGGKLQGRVLWTDGRDAFEVVGQERLISLVTSPGQSLVFPVADWCEDVSKAFDAAVAEEQRSREERKAG